MQIKGIPGQTDSSSPTLAQRGAELLNTAARCLQEAGIVASQLPACLDGLLEDLAEEEDPPELPAPAPSPQFHATSGNPRTSTARRQPPNSTGSAPSTTTVKSVQTAPPGRPSSATSLNLPPRPDDAITGSQFMDRTRKMTRAQREALILDEIEKGNVPDFARQLKDVSVSSVGKDGTKHTGTVHVMPDYVAIGSNDDFVRIPMDPRTAQRIADQTGTTLPTTKIVDDVYRQAEVKLTPQPLPPTAQMMSNEWTEKHNRLVEQQLAGRGAARGELTAGHQKDLVISNTLTQHPDRVAIYGWHQPNGRPIQPLSTVHENTYADYSHGVRLVGATMLVDGEERPVADVLRDPALAGLISKEGVIRDPRVPLR